MIPLTYGNTNTFLLKTREGYLLVDTDLPGTLTAFYRAIGAARVPVGEIRFVLATHYHPDHIGLIPSLTGQGARLLMTDTQKDAVRFSDGIFAKDAKLRSLWEPIRESGAVVLSCGESRAFFADLGLSGEIVSTPSHSPDSVSVLTDEGDCFVGDLERRGFIEGYGEGTPEREQLARDWETLLAHRPKRIFYAHGPGETLF